MDPAKRLRDLEPSDRPHSALDYEWLFLMRSAEAPFEELLEQAEGEEWEGPWLTPRASRLPNPHLIHMTPAMAIPAPVLDTRVTRPKSEPEAPRRDGPLHLQVGLSGCSLDEWGGW